MIGMMVKVEANDGEMEAQMMVKIVKIEAK
jgi:hypothetical protein